MKKSLLFVSGALLCCLFLAVVYSSCKKDPCNGVDCQNGGYCSGGNCTCPVGFSGKYCEYSEIDFYNNTFTPVNMTLNGASAVQIAPGSYVAVTGIPGDAISGTAYTANYSTSGNQIGEMVQWTISDEFPTGGSPVSDAFNVPASYFFLQIVNTSSYYIGQVFVNYQLLSQTLDNVTVPNDANKYNIGYYDAFSNSNVHLVSTDGTIVWNGNVTLPFTANQYYVFNATN